MRLVTLTIRYRQVVYTYIALSLGHISVPEHKRSFQRTAGSLCGTSREILNLSELVDRAWASVHLMQVSFESPNCIKIYVRRQEVLRFLQRVMASRSRTSREISNLRKLNDRT